MKIQKNTPLAPLTTINLGRKTRYFSEIKTKPELLETIAFAKKNKLPIQILGGGSNLIFSDQSFPGVVIKISLSGISFSPQKKYILAQATSGVNWDKLVSLCIKKNLQGIEALSGIPGTVGASPIQNIGAYGQEVSQTIHQIKALNLKTLKEEIFSNKDCQFSYRTSRFKNKDKNKYVILEVSFRLKNNAPPLISYPQLKEMLPTNPSLKQVRSTVLKLRKAKAMLENSPLNSCGSFFINPEITPKKFNQLKKKFPNIPFFPSKNKVKIPAAWLIENSGFSKGYTKNKVGISKYHALCLTNSGNSTKNLLNLAQKISQAVSKKFHLTLKIEPEIIKS